jgi:chaperonin GroEL
VPPPKSSSKSSKSALKTPLGLPKPLSKKVSSPVEESPCFALPKPSIRLKPDNVDEEVGIKIVKAALEQPLRWLAKNSGEDDGWVVRQVMADKSKSYGFNAQTLEFGDMLKMGILDPVKVTRSALQNAASVAAMILTTECLVTET